MQEKSAQKTAEKEGKKGEEDKIHRKFYIDFKKLAILMDAFVRRKPANHTTK